VRKVNCQVEVSSGGAAVGRPRLTWWGNESPAPATASKERSAGAKTGTICWWLGA
jgi:hypothetical protein